MTEIDVERFVAVNSLAEKELAATAQRLWLQSPKPISRVQPDTLKSQLWNPLEKEGFPASSLSLLENLQIFERYLYPSLTDDSSDYHVLLLMLIINVKAKHKLPTWDLFSSQQPLFSVFFKRVAHLLLDGSQTFRVRTEILCTIIHAFQSLDSGLLRKECAPLVSISILHNLHDEAAREDLFGSNSKLRKSWKLVTKRFNTADETTKAQYKVERSWLYTLCLDLLRIVYDGRFEEQWCYTYCERFLEFLCDLLAQMPTRRYVNSLLQNLQISTVLRMSPMFKEQKSWLLLQLHRLLDHFLYFPVDDFNGHQLSDEDAADASRRKILKLQRIALEQFKDKLSLLALANHASVRQPNELRSHLQNLDDEELKKFAKLLNHRINYSPPAPTSLGLSRELLMETLVDYYERRPTFQETVRSTPVLPTEQLLEDQKLKHIEDYDGSKPLPSPKLNLQYLTTSDFLWRSFVLCRDEAFYEIKNDLKDTIRRVKPQQGAENSLTRFSGSSRMALPITDTAIVEISAAKIGEDVPAQVIAEVSLDSSRMAVQPLKEWETIKMGDVLFLLHVEATKLNRRTNGNTASGSGDQSPYKTVRTAEVIKVLDERGHALRERPTFANGARTKRRQLKLLVKLDAIAYSVDVQRGISSRDGLYKSLNLVIRRRSRENNFKSILDSIQQLILFDAPIPMWFRDVFLGTGDPSGASHKNIEGSAAVVDYRDTFLDWRHVLESLPDKAIQTASDNEPPNGPPFVIESVGQRNILESLPIDGRVKRQRLEETTMNTKLAESSDPREAQLASVDPTNTRASRKTKKRRREEGENEAADALQVTTYKPINTGPYNSDQPKLNAVRFTQAQIQAIMSGTQPGLTVVLGPPGTGKTDVATQIINNIYHNFPYERTLLLTHSNQALNQLFQKIVSLDIDERHLLRLGHGEEELQVDTETNFGKYGRVEFFLESRDKLLREVERLAQSLNAPGAHSDSCETAGYFERVYVRPAWTVFQEKASQTTASTEDVIEAFPFHIYFSNAPQPLFPPEASKDSVLDIAGGCFRHIENLFSQLADIRPFEILRNERNKANYLLVKEAKIIAMTTTHAAMRRTEIANLGFSYDNVIVEEAAQITEIENFIPLTMQNPKDGINPLKRIVLCGDHLQNSPVVQSIALQQYANLDQSLFQRLVRLGIPLHVLDQQGRARPSLSELYRWRYPNLGNLPSLATLSEFKIANAGLKYEYQFIEVPDYKGKGEAEPSPHFIQNLGEAEYTVAMYMYLRLLGYPASKISILTMYTGQKALIRDVLAHRCAKNRLFGLPRIVTTVDKYQGEQNDYVLLSLVRTSRIGFLRDIRRMTVALSRARLGLYVFGRRQVFENCVELKEAFEKLFERPTDLRLVLREMYPASRLIAENVEDYTIEGVEHLGQYVFEMTQAKIKNLKAGTEQLPETRVDSEIPEGDEDSASEVAGDEIDGNADPRSDESDGEGAS